MSGTDTTLDILNQGNTYVMLLLKNIANAHKSWDKNAAAVAKACSEKNIPLFVVSAVAEMASERLKDIPGIHYLQCDATVIKTAARVQPTYFLMQGSTILNKFSYLDIQKNTP